jgi:AdoMet-dependent heme synthase
VDGAYPPPRLVFWETTAGCNLRCSHCRRTTVSDGLLPEDLTTEEATAVINQLARMGRPILVLSGGEPLLRPDIFDLARAAVEAGLTVALATNGTLVDDSVAGCIRESGVARVSVSLDGADAATHDAFRRLPGSFASAVKGIEALNGAGVPTQINVTIAKHNQAQLEAMLALSKRLRVAALHLFLLVPVGCGVEIAEEQMVDADEYERILNWLYDTEAAEPGLQLKATCAPHYFRVMRQRGGPGAVPRSGMPASHHRQVALGEDARLHTTTRGCLAGTGVCFVSHEGKLFGCGYLPVEAGDLRAQGFAEAWQGSPVFAQLRDAGLLKGKCGLCEFRGLCGGCRARAYGMTGDVLAEEPLCAYQPARTGREVPGRK